MTTERIQRLAAILRGVTPGELVDMFVHGNRSHIRWIANRVRLTYSGDKTTEVQATQIVKACIHLPNDEYLMKLVLALTQPISKTAEELLGASFDEPTQADLDGLTPKLVEKHGRLMTMLYYAHVIAAGNHASSMLEQYFVPNGLFEVKEDAPKPILLPKPKVRSVDGAKRELRKQRKDKRKKPFVAAKPAAQKKLVKAKPKSEAKPIAKTPAKSEPRKAIEQRRLVHPHITPGKGVSPADMSVGSVVMAYIPYKPQDPAGEGKLRPCVVIAAGPAFLLVRPIYSNPRRYAQHWRSVRLEEWRLAGLERLSYVSIQRHMVLRRRSSQIGELSIRDWNRICRGEVNSAGDL